MTTDTAIFVNGWTFENVNVEHYEPGDDIINPLVEKLISDAHDAGITVEKLTEDVGHPRDIITEALGERMSEEQDRWLEKNP